VSRSSPEAVCSGPEPRRMSINSRRVVQRGCKGNVVPSMRALIVDDEPIARKVLREELELLDSIEVVGEAEDGQAALLKISSTKPDIVFLDIQMPVMTGLELLGHLTGGHLPAIVMVTAYDQHAIRAFEAGAVDYLLKPISQQRLTQAVERAKRITRSPVRVAENLVQLQEISPIGTGAPEIRKIVGKRGEDFFC
jgi:two-component system, LytTR family, response regulator